MKDSPQRNIDILKYIANYCTNIEKLIERFGNNIDDFKADIAFRDSVSMNILQIGELANRLSEEYRTLTENEIPWHAIRAMRNLFAHNYGQMNVEVIWNTATNSIPRLKYFCEEQINVNELLEEQSVSYEDENGEDFEI